MMEYNEDTITYNGVDYNIGKLNSSHIAWHLTEIYNAKSFLENLNESYSFPEKIHYMSIAEGQDFDALLVDDKMFRYTKINENDLLEVQDYINKYAYASALLKLNECANIIGPGLHNKYTLDESYNYLSLSYNTLFENFHKTNEKGKLVESYNGMNVYEGNDGYLRNINGSQYKENWEDTFKHKNIDKYVVESVKQVDDIAVITFIDKTGAILEAHYANTESKILECGFNIIKLIDKKNLVESYRVGTLNEYHQPFTMKYATITAYDWDGNRLMLNVSDAFGNSGTLPMDVKLSKDDFMKKYKRQLDDITKSKTFKDGVEKTSKFISNSAEDLDRFNKLIGRSIEDKNNENQLLSYKVEPFKPKVGDSQLLKKIDDTKFSVDVEDDEDNDYTLTYLYTGVDDIDNFISDITAEIDEYDFNNKSDVIEFYQLLDDYGDVEKSYPKGKTNGNRKRIKININEAEGVQTSDIAPKLDQNIGSVIKVKMKRKKDKINTKDLLINTINEQDEFYGARGFIKDEKGRYHFNDYYINESGKVVHKSKLNEGYFSELEVKNQDDKIAFEKWKEENSDRIADYYTSTYSKDLKNINQEVWDNIAKDIYDEERLPEIINKDIKESFNPTGYTKVIDAISAGIETDEDKEALKKYLQDIINYCKEIADDYDVLVESEKIHKYKVTLKNGKKKVTISTTASSKDAAIKQVCNSEKAPESAVLSVTDEGSVLKEYIDTSMNGDMSRGINYTSPKNRNSRELYYMVNDVTLALQKVKPFIKEDSEEEKIYNELIIKLNELQIKLGEED